MVAQEDIDGDVRDREGGGRVRWEVYEGGVS